MCLHCRGAERGTARPEVLQELLKTTERVVQEIDSVEYGLTDIQEYYGAARPYVHLLRRYWNIWTLGTEGSCASLGRSSISIHSHYWLHAPTAQQQPL